MKVFVISGFLGAGKTTFIKALARRTGRDFAILENEYGEVGVDGALLEEDRDKVNIWELTEGCICCSMKSDFASSILTIANTIDPEYLIVEPTGVGLLGQVMENLRQIQYERIELLSPVTLLDGHSFDRYLKEFPEIYADQIAAAGTVLVSKMENADPSELEALGRELRKLNTTAEIHVRHYSQNPDDWWEGLLKKSFDPEHPIQTEADAPELENLGLSSGLELADANQLLVFLQGVVSGVFGDICRAKGYLKVGDAWLHFEVADRRYTVTGTGEQTESRAVFIGENLRRSWLREVLQVGLRTERPRDWASRRRRKNPMLTGVPKL